MEKLICGDALEELKKLKDNSVDSIVTDPPAGIGFMGKEWDKDKGGKDMWIRWLGIVMSEAIRVLKPGGHALVWALPRTSHWTATALEEAGFEIRDCVYHIFGSGFPKSLNVRKSAKKAGLNYEKIDEGLGTALKPAVECWWLCRKPISEKTVAENVLKWGTGGLNIDGSRIGFEKGDEPSAGNRTATFGTQETRSGGDGSGGFESNNLGRFPAHLIHDGSEEVLSGFPNDSQRFFYCAKPSKSERDEGLEKFPDIDADDMDEQRGKATAHNICPYHHITNCDCGWKAGPRKNNHPTVKAQALMSYLIKLITPPKGIVLDMFAGSGSTLIAAKKLGHSFIGIEKESDYIKIAEARLKSVNTLL